MAACDYRLCDVCGQKAFYDAELDYGDSGMPMWVGDWCVICTECAKTHECRIVPKETQP